MNFFLIHGAYGSPKSSWFPWLKSELEKSGREVFAPEFPTPENQSLNNWLKLFEPYKHNVTENSVFVCHSLGAAFVLKIIEDLKKPIKACFFVAGFVEFIDDPRFDKINKTFVDRKFDWKKIKKNCKQFCVFHSDNDPYVPLSKGELIAKNRGVNLILVSGAGHFNEKFGYNKFPDLLDKVNSVLKYD